MKLDFVIAKEINTYWSYIVRTSIFINLASNILLLASKKYFLTSQGLVGAGMNRRALLSAMKKSYLMKGVSSFGGRQFSTILLSVHLKSDLIRGMTFGERGILY